MKQKKLVLLHSFFALFVSTMLFSNPAFAENKIIGSKQCSDSACHQNTFDQMLFHPHESFFNKDYEEKGKTIASKMKVADHFEDEKCIKCHGTEVASTSPKVPDEELGLYGIICETCHNPAEGWVEIHDKKGKVQESIAKGMRDTRNLYAWAKDCFACHRGAKEDYVVAGHRLGDKFDLIKYSQGDFKHWVWSKEDKATGNLDSKLKQKLGKIWVTGEVFQVQTSIARIVEAAGKSDFTNKNNVLLKKAVSNLELVVKSIPSDNLMKIISVAKKVNGAPASAKSIFEEVKTLAKTYIDELAKAQTSLGKFASLPFPQESDYIRIKR